MKSTASSPQLVKALILFFLYACLPARACGPFEPIIPTPRFFGLPAVYKSMADYDRTENLRLWQSLTSPRIPLSDIEHVVYSQSLSDFVCHTGYDPDESANLFYTYLNNTEDWELMDFLRIAKVIEERRKDMLSPWYYPASRGQGEDPGDFDDMIAECKSYSGDRLRDRYALQVVRALFASRRYAECALYADSAFASFPDSNLMKRMAQRYAAGCWTRLGQVERADTVFAISGDIRSVSPDRRISLMASLNPDAPQFMDYIRSHSSDTVFMIAVRPVADRLLRQGKVASPGDWNFLLAHISQESLSDSQLARTHILRAMQQPFSSPELHDLARIYKMKLDAITGHTSSLLADLRWVESKIDVLAPDTHEWIRRLQNIVYADWIPRLWKKSDYATAILLCSYADNLEPSDKKHVIWSCWDAPASLTKSAMRQSENYPNQIDYGSLSFQLMGSLSSAQLSSAYNRMMSSTPLYTFLRRNIRTDADYYFELIGTLALREENYTRAVSYLSRVSEHYLRTTNIFKDGYLGQDPFAKLTFARRMRDLKQSRDHGRTDDVRGIARLKYAMERYASFEDKWALTQYWRGWVGIFYPALVYWCDDFAGTNYAFLYDYAVSDDQKKTEALYKTEVAAALAMLTTDEARAEAQFILGNVRTVIRNYADTAAAAKVKSSCDGWENWL